MASAILGPASAARATNPQAKNAVDDRMAEELDETLQRVARDDSVRALVLTGAGGAFCAGGDIRGMTAKPERTPEMWRNRMRCKFLSR